MIRAAYTQDGQTIDSERFYAVACDPRRHVMVEACAGAGKTWMLVSRILRALLEGAEPQQILAITFTKKAAAEMRSRLQEWLEDFSSESDAKLDEELRIRGVAASDCAALRERLRGLDLQLMQSAQPLQIRTFHSWFAQLTRAAPLRLRHELGLPASYELLEDDTQITEAVWPRFWVRLQDNEELLTDLRESVAALGRSNTIKSLESVLAKRAEFAAADAAGVLETSVLHFSEQFSDFAGMTHPDERFLQASVQSELKNAAAFLGKADGKTYIAKAVELEMACTSGWWEKSLKILLNADGSVPAKTEIKGPSAEENQAILHARKICRAIYEARQQHAAWQHQQRMVRLSRVLLDEFANTKRERGWVDMGDIEHVAHRLLNDAAMGAWLQEALDWRIRHLLIDEFQDTNPLQWQVLHGWLQSYAGSPSQAPALFIVGDPKQSIYRFRRADPQVFAAAKVFVREGLQGTWLACDHTRRNASAVIDLTNAVMAQALEENLLDGYRSHTTASDETGEVLALPLIQVEKTDSQETQAELHWRDSLNEPRELPEEHARQLEARQAARWIAQRIAQGDAPQSFMVLARKNERLARIQDELRLLRVASVRVDQGSLFDCPEVQDLVALMECLIDPANDLALARALKSPVFSQDDAALAKLALAVRAASSQEDHKLKISWREALRTVSLQDAHGEDIAQVLARWQSWLAQWPVHDALSLMMDEGQILERFAASVPAAMHSRVQANLQALLGASLSVGGGRFVSAPAFVRALKAGRVKASTVASNDAVRLLTIHKAKGLEADTVLMLDTLPGPDRSQSMGVLLDWPAEREHPKALAFVLSQSDPAPSLVNWVGSEKQYANKEDMHCLYVALTRARKRLVISASQGKNKASTSWYERLMSTTLLSEVSVASSSQKTEDDALSADREKTQVVEIQKLPSWRERLSAQDMALQVEEVDAKSDDLAARVGLALHRLLQAAPMSSPGEIWQPETNLLQTIAHEFDLSANEIDEVRQSALRIKSRQAWIWDSASVAWCSNEMELWFDGELLRLDRVIKLAAAPGKSTVWWVIDYKSADNPLDRSELVAQISRYKSALTEGFKSQGVEAVVKAGFVTARGELFELPE